MNHYTLDIETRSLYNLQKIGGLKYVLSQFTQVLVVSLCDEEYNTISWDYWSDESESLNKILSIITHDSSIVYAHNGLGFDFPCMEKQYKIKIPHAVDTMSLFSPYMLKGQSSMNLDALLQEFGKSKNEQGKKLIDRLSKPRYYLYKGEKESIEDYFKRTNKHCLERCFSVPTPKEKAKFIEYCEDDTKDLMYLVKKIPNNYDMALYDIDRKINSRGMKVDRKFAIDIIRESERVRKVVVANSKLEHDVLSSPDQFREKVKTEFAVALDSCSGDYLEEYLKNDIPEKLKIWVEARLEIAKRSASKAVKVLMLAFGCIIYNYLHVDTTQTGRWSSRGAQLQNLPWSSWDNFDNIGKLTKPSEVMSLVRFMFIPRKGYRFYICDYSGIEARIAAYLVEDQLKIQGYFEGRDFYKELASILYNVPVDEVTDQQRSVGKVAVLGCGYQMGIEKFIDYAKVFGVHLTEDEARKVVELWRDQNPLIAGTRLGRTFEGTECRTGGVWRDLQKAFYDAVWFKRDSHVAKCDIEAHDDYVSITLPSGRRLFYRNLCVKMKRDVDDETVEFAQRDGQDFVMTSPDCHIAKAYSGDGYRKQLCFGGGKVRSGIYGGKIFENICQGIGSDFLRDALIHLNDLAIYVVHHVHDEIICEVSHDSEIEKIEKVMSTTPRWAAGMPLDCEGFISDRFCKKPRKAS